MWAPWPAVPTSGHPESLAAGEWPSSASALEVGPPRETPGISWEAIRGRRPHGGGPPRASSLVATREDVTYSNE